MNRLEFNSEENNIDHYLHLNKYLKSKFGERTLKICIDAGFTCPNRDGLVGTGGCIFCSERGSGDLINLPFSSSKLSNSSNSDIIDDLHINKTEIDNAKLIKEPKVHDENYNNDLINLRCASISDQVSSYFSSYRADRANKFIAYFQNFTNTYDSIDNLKRLYDASLIDSRIVALDIATRPDCITEDIAKLLHSYINKYSVTVELGLQTSNNSVGKLINRGYSSEDFINAVNILRKYNIEVVAHIMVGLPGELKKSSCDFYPNWVYSNIAETVDFINNLDIQGIKIHSTYIVKNTELCNLYNNGKYTPITLDEYMYSVSYILTHIRPNIVIHRLSADAPKNLLVAPEWNSHKKWILNGINKLLIDKNLYQGMYYKKTK